MPFGLPSWIFFSLTEIFPPTNYFNPLFGNCISLPIRLTSQCTLVIQLWLSKKLAIYCAGWKVPFLIIFTYSPSIVFQLWTLRGKKSCFRQEPISVCFMTELIITSIKSLNIFPLPSVLNFLQGGRCYTSSWCSYKLIFYLFWKIIIWFLGHLLKHVYGNSTFTIICNLFVII